MIALVPTLDEANLGPAMLAINPQQRRFVRGLVFDGLNPTDAARASGYSDAPGCAKSTGYRLAHDPRIQEAILECSRQLLRAEGAASVRELVRLRDKSPDDKVRLRAATELCDRAGLNAVSQHTIDVTHTHKLSEAALDARILALAKEAGLDDAAARKLLIDPNVIDATFEEVPAPEKTPQQLERSERYQANGERERQIELAAMSPEEREQSKAEVREQRRAKAKEKYQEAQAKQPDLESYLAEREGIEDLF